MKNNENESPTATPDGTDKNDASAMNPWAVKNETEVVAATPASDAVNGVKPLNAGATITHQDSSGNPLEPVSGNNDEEGDQKTLTPEEADGNNPNTTTSNAGHDATKLDIADEEYLAEREQTIASGIKKFFAVGMALLEIQNYRDGILIRERYGTLENYCRKRWGFCRSQYYRYLGAAEEVRIISPKGENSAFPDPTSERQIRAISLLAEDEDKRTAWRLANEQADGKEVTGALVEAAVKKLLKDGKKRRSKERAPAKEAKKDEDDVKKDDLPPAESFKRVFEAFIAFAVTPDYAKLPSDTRETLRDLLAQATNAVTKHEQPKLLNAA